MCTHMKMLHVYVSGICCRDVSHEVQQAELHGTYRGDKITPKLVLHNCKSVSSHEGTCRCNISLKHVHATFSCVCICCDFVAARCPCNRPLVSAHLNLLHQVLQKHSHLGTTLKVFSLQHIPETCTFSCVCKCCDFVPATCPRYTTLMHVASVCTTHLFVAATCRCNMSLQHVPSCLPTFMPSSATYVLALGCKSMCRVFLYSCSHS